MARERIILALALALALALVAAAGACVVERHQALVVCHNVNCAGPPDPTRDDTLAALDESLALREDDGRPTIDGVEVDTLWNGATGRCLLAHDFDGALDVDAAAAGDALAAHLAREPVVAWNGARFFLFIELKPETGPLPDDVHTAEQLVRHADCALDLHDAVVRGAAAGGHALTVVFDSADPEVLRALVARPRWPGVGAHPGAHVELSADFGGPPPYGSSLPLAAFGDLGITVAEAHNEYMTRAFADGLISLDVDLMLWMFEANPGVLDAIESYRPSYVLTSEAPLIRRWQTYR